MECQGYRMVGAVVRSDLGVTRFFRPTLAWTLFLCSTNEPPLKKGSTLCSTKSDPIHQDRLNQDPNSISSDPFASHH